MTCKRDLEMTKSTKQFNKRQQVVHGDCFVKNYNKIINFNPSLKVCYSLYYIIYITQLYYYFNKTPNVLCNMFNMFWCLLISKHHMVLHIFYFLFIGRYTKFFW